jgi:hypothetical protein
MGNLPWFHLAKNTQKPRTLGHRCVGGGWAVSAAHLQMKNKRVSVGLLRSDWYATG